MPNALLPPPKGVVRVVYECPRCAAPFVGRGARVKAAHHCQRFMTTGPLRAEPTLIKIDAWKCPEPTCDKAYPAKGGYMTSEEARDHAIRCHGQRACVRCGQAAQYRGWTACESCREQFDYEKWMAWPRVDLPAKYMISASGRWFSDMDDFYDWCVQSGCDPWKAMPEVALFEFASAPNVVELIGESCNIEDWEPDDALIELQRHVEQTIVENEIGSYVPVDQVPHLVDEAGWRAMMKEYLSIHQDGSWEEWLAEREDLECSLCCEPCRCVHPVVSSGTEEPTTPWEEVKARYGAPP